MPGLPPAPVEREHPIAVVADVHIGNHKAEGGQTVDGINRRCQWTLDAFEQSLVQAKAHDACMFVVAGDLFHVRRPEPAVIAAVQRILQEQATDIPVVLVPGNHDMLDATAAGGNTAMEPLFREATVIREPEWYDAGDDACLYFVPFDALSPMSEYLGQSLKEVPEPPHSGLGRVLITHVGVYDDESPPWCRTARDAIHEQQLFALMQAIGFQQAFVGNFHLRQEWAHEHMRITQVGTLCPGGYGDAGYFPNVGGMALYYPKAHKVEMLEIKGPRFFEYTIPALAVGALDVPGVGGNHVFIRAPVEPGGKLPRAQASLHVEVIPQELDIPKPDLPQAEDAMQAFSDYVAAMKLPGGCTPEEVLQQVRAYWESA